MQVQKQVHFSSIRFKTIFQRFYNLFENLSI